MRRFFLDPSTTRGCFLIRRCRSNGPAKTTGKTSRLLDLLPKGAMGKSWRSGPMHKPKIIGRKPLLSCVRLFREWGSADNPFVSLKQGRLRRKPESHGFEWIPGVPKWTVPKWVLYGCSSTVLIIMVDRPMPEWNGLPLQNLGLPRRFKLRASLNRLKN
jgi:hypothetical protein